MPITKHDNFLADAVKREGRLTYMDGFRFGLGLMVAHLLVAVVVGSIACGVVLMMGWNH
jgi:hypothetical protein